MRLNRITLNGFKSFADSTVFEFNAPITAIVGPNGCGKSNVVDAIKWVLGEQSAKSLRGGAMLDVIFNGTIARKPSGLAEVTLHFDNPADESGHRFLPVDTDELAVTRRLFRDGTSEYLINRQKARLRDVRELFYDTGIGTNAYSIIEQGKVDAMLISNPIERRVIFEEAAGISKFKQRKKEAMRKLDRTEQNLLRCRDKLEEVERRLRSVKVQAGRARTFKQHTARLTELRTQFVLAEYHRLREQTDQNGEEMRQADLSRRAAMDQLSAAEQQRDQVEVARQQLLALQRELENRKLHLSATRDQARQRRQFAQNNLAEVKEQIERDQKRCEELTQRTEALDVQIEQQKQHLQQQQDQQEQMERRIESATAEQEARRHELNEAAAQLEDEKAGTVNLLRRTTALHNEINALDLQTRNLQGHRDRLTSRADELAGELNGLLRTRDECHGRLEEVVTLINCESTRLAEQKEQAEQLHGREGELTRRLDDRKEQRVAMDTRRATLQELEDSQTGLDEAVKAVLARKAANESSEDQGEFTFVRGILADLVEADVEHAVAVEAALGQHAQVLIIDRLNDLMAHRALLDSLSGRVTFLAMDLLGGYRHDIPAPPLGLVRLIDLVRFEPAVGPLLWRLLGRTYLVADLDEAMRRRRSLPDDCRFITLAGQVIEPDGRLVAGPLHEGSGAGLISRRSELADLQQRIDELDRHIAEDKSDLAELCDKSAHIERTMQELRQAIYESSTMRVELSGKLEQAQQSIEKIEREQPVIAGEVEQVYRQIQEADHQRLEHREQVRNLEAEQAESKRRAEQLEQHRAQLTDAVNEAGEKLTEARIESGQITEQIASSGRQLRQLEIAANDARRQARELDEQIDHHRQRLSQLQETITEASAQIEGLDTALGELEEELGGFAEKLNAASTELGRYNRAVAEHRRVVEQTEQQLHELQMTARELEVRSDNVRQRAHETLQLDVVAAYPDYEPQEIDWDAIKAEIDELQRKLDRLGNVNLDAIEEQGELEDREKFLAEQVNDIDRARRELEQLIEHLNNESRNRFEQTFNQVREHFAGSSGMFRKLFGGGRADLVLIPDAEGNTDWLESGVEIIAKPPGKEPQTIKLLSGGERTMVAVALLMSLFRSRPSPFCILDEVDAALDEANVERFCSVVKSFLDQSHFIVITHHKRTMQAADLLYGVTMPQRGVSKRVAVEIEHVHADGELDTKAIAAQEKAEAEGGENATGQPQADQYEPESTDTEPPIVTDPDAAQRALDAGSDEEESASRRQRLAEAFEQGKGH